MEQNRIDSLRSFYQKNGKHYFSDIKKAEALLKDYFPDNLKASNTMLTALKAGALDSLTGDIQYSMPKEVLLSNIVKKMVDDFGLTEKDSFEAVCSWSEIFGVSDSNFTTSMKKRFESASPNNGTSSFLSSTLTSSKETKECPLCGETVLAKAKICKHCKSAIETIECPYCFEDILKSSETCEHCGKKINVKESESLKPDNFQKQNTIIQNSDRLYEKKNEAIVKNPVETQSQGFDSSDVKPKKNFTPVFILNLLWAGSGYFYLGKYGWAIFFSGLNLVFFTTGVMPVIFFFISTIHGYSILKQINSKPYMD